MRTAEPSITNTSILLIAPRNTHQETAAAFLQTFNRTPNDPDTHFVNTPAEPLQIDQVRQLSQDILLQPYQTDRSIFVIYGIDRASVPAQNALLKMLEEPPAHSQIVLTTDRPEQVLPTIQSRCVTQNMTASAGTETNLDYIKEIIDQLPGKPLSYAFELSEKYKERTEALEFTHHLLEWMHQRNQTRTTSQTTQALREILIAQQQLEKNVNVRLAIEELFFRLKNLVD